VYLAFASCTPVYLLGLGLVLVLVPLLFLSLSCSVRVVGCSLSLFSVYQYIPPSASAPSLNAINDYSTTPTYPPLLLLSIDTHPPMEQAKQSRTVPYQFIELYICCCTAPCSSPCSSPCWSFARLAFVWFQ
jgi:hypothetical protein